MKRRRWLAPLGSILFGLFLLVSAEALLRLAWTPPLLPTEQLAAVVVDPFVVSNGRARTKKSYLGAMRSSSFSVPKRDGTFRVFCIGGSTTLGYPYAAEFAWPASLDRRLKQLFPAREVEVINVGAASYGSARTLALLRGILTYQPDMVIVATGDAEFVEDSFRVAVNQPAPVVTWLHSLHLSRLLKKAFPERDAVVQTVDAEDQSAAGFLFAPVVAGTVYRVNSARRATVMAALVDNLSTMTDVAKKAGVPLVLTTLPANVADWPPDPDNSVPTDPQKRLRWQQHVATARKLVDAGNQVGAIEEYTAAASLWNGNASVCYDFGRLLLAVGKPAAARDKLMLAVDFDPIPVRATSQVNQLIRRAADAAGVLLADAEKALSMIAPNGLVGDNLILDYAHPTPLGHVEIARVVLQSLLQDISQWQVSEEQEMLVHQSELSRVMTTIPEINAELSFALGQVFERKGLNERAVKMYRQAIEQSYQGPFPSYNLARLLSLQGRNDEALALLSPLVKQYPDWQEPYGLLGYLYQQTGNKQTAIIWYHRALQAGDLDPRLYGTLAELEISVGQQEQAAKMLKEGLQRYPDDCGLLVSFGVLLEQNRENLASAEDFYRRSLKRNPSCQLLWESLGLLLMQQQRWREAEKVFTAALLQPAPLAQHHLNLGYVYLKGLIDKTAAGEQFDRFQTLKPKRVDLVPQEFRRPAAQREKP